MLKLFIQVSIRNVSPVKEGHLEKSVVCVLHHNPSSLKTLKKAIGIEISRYSNGLFPATTGLSSSINISFKNLTFVEADSVEKAIVMITASKSC